MTCQPITCNGDDLAAVCADIRLRGGCIEAMDVVGRAMYRVSYFERVAEEKTQRNSRRIIGTSEVKYADKPSHAGLAPAALNHLPKPMHIRNVAAGGETRAEKPKSVPDAPASIFGIRRNRSNATQTSTRPVSEEACKQRDPAMGTEMRADGLTRVSTEGDIAEPSGSGWAHPTNASISNLPVPVLAESGVGVQSYRATQTAREAQESTTETLPSIPTGQTLAAGNSISIESRLAALQSKLIASGKIRRSKPKTEARLPYAD